jgi:hypothetical protein
MASCYYPTTEKVSWQTAPITAGNAAIDQLRLPPLPLSLLPPISSEWYKKLSEERKIPLKKKRRDKYMALSKERKEEVRRQSLERYHRKKQSKRQPVKMVPPPPPKPVPPRPGAIFDATVSSFVDANVYFWSSQLLNNTFDSRDGNIFMLAHEPESDITDGMIEEVEEMQRPQTVADMPAVPADTKPDAHDIGAGDRGMGSAVKCPGMSLVGASLIRATARTPKEIELASNNMFEPIPQSGVRAKKQARGNSIFHSVVAAKRGNLPPLRSMVGCKVGGQEVGTPKSRPQSRYDRRWSKRSSTICGRGQEFDPLRSQVESRYNLRTKRRRLDGQSHQSKPPYALRSIVGKKAANSGEEVSNCWTVIST